MNILVSIVIVNYNTENLLKDCIYSIKQKTRNIAFEIIVVDNNSKLNSLDILIKENPDVNFVLSDHNWGFGVANNIGVKQAKGKFIFFLNPDTLLINNAVLELYNYMRSKPMVGICGGNMYKGDMTPCSSFYNIDFLHLEYQILLNRKRYPGFNYSNTPKNVKTIVGADLFVRKQLFDELGGFDKDFFMYFEEVELCHRVRRRGYKIVSIPSAQIIHLQGGSAENKNEELKKWSFSEHWFSKLIFFKKTKTILCPIWINTLYQIKMRLAIIYFKIKKNQEKLNYWSVKKDIIKKAYERYLNYNNKIS